MFTAHARHSHDEATTNISIPPEIFIGGGLLLGLILFWFITARVCKMSLSVKLMIMLSTLLVTGILSYQVAPITSMISLSIGLTLTLGSVLAQLVTSNIRSEDQRPS